MNIAKKILLGYGFLLILVFVHLVYALSSLDQMDKINTTVTRVNQPLHELAENLAENLLEQEYSTQRLSILKNDVSFELLQIKFRDFEKLLKDIQSINNHFASVSELLSKCTSYKMLMSENYSSLTKACALSVQQADLISQMREELIERTKKLGLELRRDQSKSIQLSEEIGSKSYRVLLVFGVGSIFLAAAITFFFARSIAHAVGQLKLATRQIAAGKFEEVKSLNRADEFGDVSRSIADMSRKIAHLEKLYLATNPLTLLPGGLAIDDTLKKRLDSGIPTALCVIDLDNFKAFNDRYGFARGNEVIQTTALIVAEAVKKSGKNDNFIGHIGGDDFVVITSPERYEDICKCIIQDFDEKIVSLYDEEDRQRGTIIGTNRQGAEVIFPLMTVSIAVVTDQGGTITEPHVLSRRAAELKEHAKSLAGSVYVIDKRRFKEER